MSSWYVKKLITRPQTLVYVPSPGFFGAGQREMRQLMTKPLNPSLKFRPNLEGERALVARNVDLRHGFEVGMRALSAVDVQLLLAENHKLPPDPSDGRVLDYVHRTLSQGLPRDLFHKVGVAHVRASSNRGDLSSRSLKTIFEECAERANPPGQQTPAAAATTYHISLYGQRLSIGMSLAGDTALWKRGYKEQMSAVAPLPENVAASCVAEALVAWRGYDYDDKQMWEAQVETRGPLLVLNPFAGSGTLGFEAALSLTGLGGTAAFHTAPQELGTALGLPDKTLEFLGRKLATPRAEALPALCVAMSDADADAVAVLSDNVGHFASATGLGTCDADGEGAFEGTGVLARPSQLHFFEAPIESFLAPGRLKERGGGSVLLLLNPPHGRRMGKESNMNRMYDRVGARVVELFTAWLEGGHVGGAGKFAGMVVCPTEEAWSIMQSSISKVAVRGQVGTGTSSMSAGGLGRATFETTNFTLGGHHMRCLSFSISPE